MECDAHLLTKQPKLGLWDRITESRSVGIEGLPALVSMPIEILFT